MSVQGDPRASRAGGTANPEPPPRRSQGADLAQLLEAANYDATQRGARFRGAPLSVDVDLDALHQGASPEDDVLDLDAIAASLARLPLSELLEIDPEYLEAAGIADLQVADAEGVPQVAPPEQREATPSAAPRGVEAPRAAALVNQPARESQHQQLASVVPSAAPDEATVDDVEAWLDSL